MKGQRKLCERQFDCSAANTKRASGAEYDVILVDARPEERDLDWFEMPKEILCSISRCTRVSESWCVGGNYYGVGLTNPNKVQGFAYMVFVHENDAHRFYERLGFWY